MDHASRAVEKEMPGDAPFKGHVPSRRFNGLERTSRMPPPVIDATAVPSDENAAATQDDFAGMETNGSTATGRRCHNRTSRNPALANH